MVYPTFPIYVSAAASFVESFLSARKEKEIQQKRMQQTLLIYDSLIKPAMDRIKRCSYCSRIVTTAKNCEGCGAPR